MDIRMRMRDGEGDDNDKGVLDREHNWMRMMHGLMRV
jgi:hypothetical protein